MKLPSNIKFSNSQVKDAFLQLKDGNYQDKQVYKWLLRAFEDIEENAFCGIQIPKKIIPKEYVQKYEVHNLWKYNLPNAWKLLYSVENNEIIVVSIVLDWMNHKEYERTFKYS
ncbi:MAG: hypothetical protein ACMXYB_04785 [Candidatus Woesearchaeota archaeon]